MIDAKQYQALRESALQAAETALADGDMELFNSKTQEVKDMDAKFEQSAAAQADIEALKGAAKAPAVVASTSLDDCMEERLAFFNYVTKGVAMTNQDSSTTSSSAGAAIPTILVDRIIQEIEKAGGLLSKVTRTYYKGGVSVPTSAAKPEASWVGEREDVDNFGYTLSSVTFSYYKLKVKVAVSMLVENIAIDAFERMLVANVSEAIIKALNTAIVAGTGSGQPTGITTYTPNSGQAIETSAITYADLLEAEGAVPEAYDDAEWVMNKKTFYGSVLGLVDEQGQPIARVNVGIDGKPAPMIFGRPVNFSSDLPQLTTSTDAETVFAFIFRLEDYLLNQSVGMVIKQYTDEDTDDTVHKAITFVDGKVIDKTSLVTLATPESEG